MTASSARAFSRRLKMQGGGEFRAALSKEAMDLLWQLAIHHRLDRREVIERLILGKALAGTDRDNGLTEIVLRQYRQMAGRACG